MEYVETTGRTIEEAKEEALDQLGVDESEAEFEVLDEPKTGLFGRVRGDARVRARVAPKTPRAKQERRPRRQRSGPDSAPDKPAARSTRPPGSSGTSKPRVPATEKESSHMTEDLVEVGTQADIVAEFLEGLVKAIGAEGVVERHEVDDETIELKVVGDDLGLLIGPKGQTLTAIHELSRTVLQRRATGRHQGRVRIDIGGYRERRHLALARFAVQQAGEVTETATARALEPMNASDRKVVHDALNEVDGVHTVSEGVDPSRRVVIVPDDSDAAAD